MDSSSEEEISDSERDTVKEVFYTLLKNNQFHVECKKNGGKLKIVKRKSNTLNQVLKVSDGKFSCPLCPGKKKQRYGYADLLQHSSGVGKSANPRLRAGHLAIAKYLIIDLDESPSILQQDHDSGWLALPNAHEVQVSPYPNRDEEFVVPLTGILVNLLINPDVGKPEGVSNSILKNFLVNKGFNPNKVAICWDGEGYQRKATVSFNNNLVGFENAMSFERAFETSDHGKVDWSRKMHQSSNVFGWVARKDDLHKDNVVGRHLNRRCTLKTIAQFEAEKLQHQRKSEQQGQPGKELGKRGLHHENECNDEDQASSKRSRMFDVGQGEST